jgi:hypothetical protein
MSVQIEKKKTINVKVYRVTGDVEVEPGRTENHDNKDYSVYVEGVRHVKPNGFAEVTMYVETDPDELIELEHISAVVNALTHHRPIYIMFEPCGGKVREYVSDDPLIKRRVSYIREMLNEGLINNAVDMLSDDGLVLMRIMIEEKGMSEPNDVAYVVIYPPFF